jgi:hypothetical protein
VNKKYKMKQIVGIAIITIVLITLFCGCIKESSTINEIDLSRFLGIWKGNIETVIVGFRTNNTYTNFSRNFENGTRGNFTDFMRNTTVIITQLEFTYDTLSMTITLGNETLTNSFSYTVEGEKILYELQFPGEKPAWGQRPSSEGEQPPFNGEEEPFNREPPFEGQQTPFNGERPFNGSNRFPENAFIYSFNDAGTILYLDGSEFVKIY